jgi:CRISPR-associated endonuclease/helicase Cas3
MVDSFQNARKYWGKSSRVNPQDYLPVHQHLVDAGSVAKALTTTTSISHALGDHWKQPESKCASFLIALAKLHDVGKYSKGFQSKNESLHRVLLNEGALGEPLHHTKALRFLLASDASETSEAFQLAGSFDLQDLVNFLAPSIGHHGNAVAACDVSEASTLQQIFPEHYRVAAWKEINEILREHPELTDFTRLFINEELLDAGHWSWVIAGFLVTCDWVASNTDYFPFDGERSGIDAVKKIGLQEFSKHPRLPSADFEFKPDRAMQLAVQDLPLYRGAVYVIEDETGSGKTEAAWILTKRIIDAGLASGAYVGLPTQATANAMFSRFSSLPPLLDAGHSSILAHPDRNNVPAWLNVVQGNKGSENVLECNAWFQSDARRSLLTSVGAGTIDQLLVATLPVKHQCLRLYGAYGKVIIVDEVHAYGAYQNELLQEFLEHHSALGGVAILLSATLPKAITKKFTGLESHDSYPRITHQQGTKFVPSVMAKPKTVKVIHTEEDAFKVMLKAAEEGKSACWIRNTVDDAINAYKELEASGHDCILLHSRYAQEDRVGIESELIRRVGNKSTSEKRGVLVLGTQVLEQSLDIDFDEMVTDLAPMDYVLQRMGRLHRHSRDNEGNATEADTRPPAVMHVYAPSDEEYTDGALQAWNRGSSFVYSAHHVMWKTLTHLRQHPTFSNLQHIDDAVQQTYDGIVPEELAAAQEESLAKEHAESQQGAWRTLDLPAGYHTHTDPLPRMEAPTRLGSQSYTIILVKDGKPARASIGGSRIRASRKICGSVPLENSSTDATIQDQIERGFIDYVLEENTDYYTKKIGLHHA